MTIFKNIRLGLLHVAVAVSLVPITGVLNRIMIHELGILASLVAALIVLPYLLSPAQVWIGQYSDNHPLWGYRRTPYIAAGIILCAGGATLTPWAALMMAESFWLGLLVAVLVFLTWGVGFNLAVVSYLSLASDLSEEHQRSRTIAVMWFMMITSVIITAIVTGNALESYSPARLMQVFLACGGVSLALGAAGLIGLEQRNTWVPREERHSSGDAVRAVMANPHARRFFVYLMLLLAAILGQDVLLEPFGAQAFGMSVRETTQLTATWGGATLVALLLQGLVLSRFMSKKAGATLGGALAALGLFLIALSGAISSQTLFVPAIALLGFGTGIATTTNLALMLDMTTPEQVGLFIGAWGVADSMARGLGNLLAGGVRDIAGFAIQSPAGGYVTVFLLEGLMLCVAMAMLRRIDVSAFRSEQPSLTQLIAVVGDA
ncbi:BCD family MFS transporter [Oscillochloris sp. ZM17-4]|uniref:BCD family MFS transporter n=1 Tax=Oscillochloris sp. ZM17-4 TaxID=2866714 RepID=UPI001C73A45F|nr:BCD family MFS transporter [Oscillochloris sp. ZM17-4]MBX0326372.1 BCD family MFS transporter [Oscillochloris sp. ZM17-4]